jgi:hypothetical protein
LRPPTIFGEADAVRSALKWQDNHPELGKFRIKLWSPELAALSFVQEVLNWKTN